MKKSKQKNRGHQLFRRIWSTCLMLNEKNSMNNILI